jgi:hypothetical protein
MASSVTARENLNRIENSSENLSDRASDTSSRR